MIKNTALARPPLPSGEVEGAQRPRVREPIPIATLQRARALRQTDSPPERILWSLLRDRRLSGYKFRRQVPIGNYYADFLCEAAKLIVELDGESHAGRERYDAQRDAAIGMLGYRVLRFSNAEFMRNKQAILETILHSLTLTANAARPLPKGEVAVPVLKYSPHYIRNFKLFIHTNKKPHSPLPSGEVERSEGEENHV